MQYNTIGGVFQLMDGIVWMAFIRLPIGVIRLQLYIQMANDGACPGRPSSKRLQLQDV